MIFGKTVLEFKCSLLSLVVAGDDVSLCVVPEGGWGSWRDFLLGTPEGGGRDDVLWVPPISAGGLGSLLRSQPCLSAWGGVIRAAGSHSKHRWRKSINSGSSQPLRALLSSLLPGGPLTLPLRERPAPYTTEPSGLVETVQYLGFPFEELKNALVLLHPSSIFLGGIPSTSIMHANWSPSSSPGNNGYPVNNSAKMHPKLHMSIAIPYFAPRIISGAL